MGTNFYFFTKNKKAAEQIAPCSYVLVDDPDFGYEIHVAKTSAGWLPLFQGHENGAKSVREYEKAYNSGNFIIYDEYGTSYSWNEFDRRVLQFNGGVRGAIPITKNIKQIHDKKSILFDPDMPDHIPVSHFEYGNGKYANDYFTDKDGYEFDIRWFE